MPVIQVVIFRGTGGVLNPDSPYRAEPALVRAGHVGVIGVVEDTIIGFHPTPEITESLGEAGLVGALRDHQPQPGCLQDDTAVFKRAYDLIEATAGRTTVYTYGVEITQATLEEIRTWYNEKRESPYNFPFRDGKFRDGESNCAVFWFVQFGVPIPLDAQTGRIRELTEHMQKERYRTWTPYPS